MLNVAFKLIHYLFLNSIFDRYPRSREDKVYIQGAAVELVNERLPLHKKCKNSRCNLAFSKEAFLLHQLFVELVVKFLFQ